MEDAKQSDSALETWMTWRKLRHAELAGPESWLGLAGLFWLESGLNRVGSAGDAMVCLPGGPPHLGDLRWHEGQVFWQPVDGPSREMQTDIDGQPSVVEFANWSFFLVDREGRLAVRLRDRLWAEHLTFDGLSYFDFDPAWQIEADWLPLSPPVAMEVPNVSGELKVVEVSHLAQFEMAGQAVRLLPMAVGESDVFFVFRDRTSGKDTYGAGRFLKAVAAVNGKITLNFNYSYNPPCAFTPFATCPLPPPENWLPFAVLAGEKKWSNKN